MGGLKISLKVNSEEIKALMNRFESFKNRAHDSALNRATKKVETDLVDRAYEKINLKKRDLKETVSVRGKLGEITIGGRAISLSRFLSSEPRKTKKSKGVSVKLWRDKEKVLFAGSFAAYGGGGNFHIFKRVGKDRLPIKKLHGKGVRDMWEIPSFSDGIIEVAQKVYSDRFISSFLAFIEKDKLTP